MNMFPDSSYDRSISPIGRSIHPFRSFIAWSRTKFSFGVRGECPVPTKIHKRSSSICCCCCLSIPYCIILSVSSNDRFQLRSNTTLERYVIRSVPFRSSLESDKIIPVGTYYFVCWIDRSVRVREKQMGSRSFVLIGDRVVDMIDRFIHLCVIEWRMTSIKLGVGIFDAIWCCVYVERTTTYNPPALCCGVCHATSAMPSQPAAVPLTVLFTSVATQIVRMT